MWLFIQKDSEIVNMYILRKIYPFNEYDNNLGDAWGLEFEW